MLTSKRQEWILQMIKGPDLSPVGNCPGRYTSKGMICIRAGELETVIQPTDVLELSDPDFLIVHTSDRDCTIPWAHISNLDFDEQQVVAPDERLRQRPMSHRILPFPMGKKAG